VNTWSEILGIERAVIGIDDNFFELGGHSLKAIMLAARIHRELEVKIPLNDIFKTPTIRKISGYIKNAKGIKYVPLEAAEKKEYYPSSLTQKRFYIMQNLDPGNVNYNLTLVLIIEGKPQKDRLKETFAKLIKRHKSLRTSFKLIDGQLVQEIHDRVEMDIRFYRAPGKEAKKIVRYFVKPFNLDTAPLIRVGLIKSEEAVHILMIDMHHIITDGISSVILSREFVALYEDKGLPPLLLQYTDFSEWQNSKKEQERINKQGEYWLKQFENQVPILRLRTDYPRPPVRDFTGGVISFRTAAEETKALNHLLIRERASLFMVLFSIYNILLWKLTGQVEIITGTGVANREHADLMNIIGLFFNTIPLLNRLDTEKSFNGFLKDVTGKTLEAFENQEYPVDILVEDLIERGLFNRDPSRNPLFDTMFVLQNFGESTGAETWASLTGLTIEPYQFEKQTSRFDLFFEATQRQDTIYMRVEYSTRLFKPSTVQNIADNYLEILNQVLEDSEIKINDITISSNLVQVKSTVEQKEYMNFKF
jgi:fengycin family lipopeptide synthetase D